MRAPASTVLLLLCYPLLGQELPSRSELPKLIKAYFAADGRSRDGHRERQRILARLDLLPPLAPREVKSWKRRLRKWQARGRKLEKKGRGWFWEDRKTHERRGLYIVGGTTRRPKGLLIGLHGGGAGAGDAGSAHAAYTGAAKRLGWISICPQVLERTEHGWIDSGTEEFVLELLDCALRTWKIDPNHVYLTGHSMGGYGTWTLGAHHADRFAGLAPSAGAPTPTFGDDRVINGIVEGIIPNLRNLRLVIYQSADDPRVPPEPNRKAVELLGKAKKRWGGYDFDYLEVDSRGHGFPEGGPSVLLEKIASAARNPLPGRITWQPVARWKRQLYWLYWEHPYTRAIVVADLDRAHNAIAITCDHPQKGLQVLLDERLVDMRKEVVVTMNGDKVFRGVPQPALSTLVLTSVRNDRNLVFSARVPAAAAGR